MLEYGFEQEKDFTPILGKSSGGRPSKDYAGCKVFNALANQDLTEYALTLDMAKEISMIQRSDKGKQARQYFIACEKRLFAPKPRTHLEVVESESVAILQASGKT
jgi:phage anti-repressor protein